MIHRYKSIISCIALCTIISIQSLAVMGQTPTGSGEQHPSAQTIDEQTPTAEDVKHADEITPTETTAEGELNVRDLILEHLADSYGWHVTNIGDKQISIPLPIILHGENGWDIFLSSKFHHGTEAYKGYYIAHEGTNKGKIVELNSAGQEVRPIDISITKNVFSLLLSSIVLIIIVLNLARWYRRRNQNDEYVAPKGFVGFMEMMILSVKDRKSVV